MTDSSVQRSVLLLNSHSRDGVYVSPPVGLVKIANVLRKGGVACDILDYDIDDEAPFLEKARRGAYAVIGMSVTHFQMEADLDRVWKFRQTALQSGRPSWIVGGGQEAAMNFRQWLDVALDLIFLGFAEKTFLEFCRRVLAQEAEGDARGPLSLLTADMDGVAFLRDDGGTVFRPAGALEPALFKELFFDNVMELDVDYAKYWNRVRADFESETVGAADFVFENVRLYTSSHCPRRCGFCSSQTFLPFSQDGASRILSVAPEQLIALLHRYKDRYGARMIQFSDDDFGIGAGAGMQRVTEFCRLVIEEKAQGTIPRDFRFSCQARVADFLVRGEVTEDALAAMARAGFLGLSLGVETFSQKLLKAPSINKVGVTVADCRKVLDAALRQGLVPQINIILGIPESTPDDLVETMLETCACIEKGCDVALVTRVEVYQGSPMSTNPDYTVRWRHWTNPHDGREVAIADYFEPRDPVIAHVCDHFKTAMAAELQAIKKERGWEGKTAHKRIVAFANLIAVSRLLERPDLVKRFQDAVEATCAAAAHKSLASAEGR